MLTTNQVFISKPTGHLRKHIEDVKRINDTLKYSATTINYEDLTLSRTVDQDVNDLWFREWWTEITEEGAWEREIDHFAKCLKEASEKCSERHKEDVTKDKEFFQSIIGNTYQLKWCPKYIFIRSMQSIQYLENKRQYVLDIIGVDCETGEIQEGNNLFTHNEISTIYEPCQYEEFIKAIESVHKSEISKYTKLREECLSQRKKER